MEIKLKYIVYLVKKVKKEGIILLMSNNTLYRNKVKTYDNVHIFVSIIFKLLIIKFVH